jgi:hypothetical protein
MTVVSIEIKRPGWEWEKLPLDPPPSSVSQARMFLVIASGPYVLRGCQFRVMEDGEPVFHGIRGDDEE